MDYKNCQSCGMPLRKDPGGTNADGTKHAMDYSLFTRGIPGLQRWKAS